MRVISEDHWLKRKLLAGAFSRKIMYNVPMPTET